MKNIIVDSGFVGIFGAIVSAQLNKVVCLEKVELLNHKESPIEDREIEYDINRKLLYFCAALEKADANNSVSRPPWLL